MAVRFGMNLFLWTDDPTQESLLPLYERLATMGYDGLELPLFGATPEALAQLGRRLDDLGLARTAVTVCNSDANPVAPDAAGRKAATRALRHAVDCAEAAGAELLGGPLYAALGEFTGEGPRGDELAFSQEVLGEVADHAAQAGIALSLEFLNRFEIYLLNTAAQTTDYLAALGRGNVSVHYDTFHAHIEEKDPAAAIRATGDAIGHVHISESDRSTPGAGQVRWGETFDALHAIGYDGWFTIEAFGSALASLAAATKIWRRMFEDEETLAAEGLAFMKSEWERRTSR